MGTKNTSQGLQLSYPAVRLFEKIHDQLLIMGYDRMVDYFVGTFTPATYIEAMGVVKEVVDKIQSDGGYIPTICVKMVDGNDLYSTGWIYKYNGQVYNIWIEIKGEE